MPAPSEVRTLVGRFAQSRASYVSGRYNETQTRIEFVDPFFTALGWDVANVQGYAEAYKDVVHEDTIVIGGLTKAPDYCFRVGGARKFFVETKRPALRIRDDAGAAFQLRRYAWSAKLPLSILTNFAELAVYDCRIKPERNDPASTARVLYFTCDEYDPRWDELAGIFAKDAVLKGSFDRYAESTKTKRGTAEVDDAFLAEIEGWREELARNLALRNPGLSQRELNFAVQRTIDRIIFLRICEDRGIEPYGRLQALLNGPNVYARLGELFQRADERYNSGLFHFNPEKGRSEPPDELTLGLAVDDKVLKDILRRLYYPESPYAFSVLPADILGQVYEQFLGKVIRLTPGHRAVVEEKPEVRKAGGVYYTPTYIVDYIVKHTVGVLLEGKTPQEVGGFTKDWKRSKKLRPLRVLDPACGSGSFLLGAYQYLLDWYRDRYVEDGPENHARGKHPRLYQGPRGEWRLTTAERKRILLTHIYGVDIDPQAVEVTKLSLLLKVLEGETQETLDSFWRLFQERALPDLGSNIKCGNSLIGPDFFERAEYSLLDEEERYRINPFDWHAEFPDVFFDDDPGFDAVVGNPPYGARLSQPEINYLKAASGGQTRTSDSFELFLLAGARLLSLRGRLSMIIPASWLTGDKYVASRRVLVTTLTPVAAYVLPFDVFRGAYVDTAIVVLGKSSYEEHCLVHLFAKKERLRAIPHDIGTPVKVTTIRNDGQLRLTPILSDSYAAVLEKLRGHGQTFGDWFRIQRGVQPYSRRRHTEEQIRSRFLHATSRLSGEYLPELQGKELSRYAVRHRQESYLRLCDEIASLRPIEMFLGERIVLRRLLTRQYRLQASLVVSPMVTTDNVLSFVPRLQSVNLRYALGILNSRLISWFYVNTSMIAQKDDFPQVHISALSALPLPETDRARHDKMVSLVQTMLDLHEQLAAAKTAHEKTLLQRQIAATDQQIDQLVYDLYGLTEEEIAIVQGEGNERSERARS